MGNKVPTEANMGDSLRCTTCRDVLPACISFSNLTKRTIDNRLVYVFNGGEYFRQVGHGSYFCNDCFYKPIRDREERQRQQEQQQRKEKLSQRLQQSQQRAEQQQEQQQLSRKSVEFERKQSVLKQQLDEFSPEEPDEFSDDLLEVLSSQCDIPVTSLSLSHLADGQLGQIMSALDSLLFEKWTNAHPPLRTLQHAQVFITQLCTLSLGTSEGVSLQSVSNHVQSLVQNISQSADNAFENFLLTQALYLSLVNFFTDHDDSDTDAVHIAKRWAEGNLSAEICFVLNFLYTLTESLDNAIGMASVFVLNMEIQCLRLLFSTLTHLNGKEIHKEVTEMHLRLAQTNGWKPTEVLTLLKVFSEQNAEDVSITKILTLLEVYDVSPVWKDNRERSLIESIDFAGPESFYTTFQQALENQGSDVPERIAELMKHRSLDESVIKRVLNITNITCNTLQHSQNEDAKIFKRDYKIENMRDDDFQEILTQLCKAVFHTKGWWPSRSQIIRWCAVVLAEKSQPPKLVGFEEDPCVTAMIAAMQICVGNKLDIVLSSGALSEQETKEWSDFYKHLGISLNTNRRKTNKSYGDVYEADIVYGAIEDFITDYFQYGLAMMEAGSSQFIRGFIIENGCLGAGHNLNFSRLKDNEALGFAAEEFQSLMGKCSSEKMEVRHSFVREMFQVLHTDLKDNVDMKVMTLSQKLTGAKLPSRDAFVLMFLETLMKGVATDAEIKKNSNSPIVKWCFEILIACAMQFQASTSAKGFLQMVSNLVAQKLWSPEETLKLLGSLTAQHQDESFISIIKILWLMTTYQISSEWKDENQQSLLQLIGSSETQDLIQHLQNNCKAEKEKSIDTLFDEIRAMKDLDEETLEKSLTIVKHVQELIKTGDIKSHADAQRARSLSHSMKTEDVQEVLAVLCNAVHVTILGNRWWPRSTQMTSWCFLALANNGKLLQMGTGEGKSVVVAMFAALRALRGEKVDVLSSSSVLCQRDAEECADFFSYFDLTVDTNTNKTKDKDRKQCYQKDIVYGTVETFAADHLRQTFEIKDVRPDRGYKCIIIDEVDLLLLDQGIQVTYLSSSMVSMQHLNIILTMIWGHVCQYGLLTTGYETFVRGPPASFFKAIFDSMDTEGTEINDPMDILQIAEECSVVPKGFTEEIYKSEKDGILAKLKNVSQDAQINFFQEIEDYVPYGFAVYMLDDNGCLSLKKQSLNKQVVKTLKFLVLDDGLCCPLYDSEEILIDPIAELISDQLHYTPSENKAKKINIPGFLKGLVEKKLATWVQNAFLAMRLKEGQEYVVEDDHIYPVDFKSTGIVELNKKWGEGLQQFVEIKHQIKLSTMSAVTNYVSNVSFFEKYNGKIYGLTGTLGSKTDMMFLNEQYPSLSACEMPTFNRKKLFEVKGFLKPSTEEWKSEVKRLLLDQISLNSYRKGRAALVICETINKVNDLYEELKDSIPGEVIVYARSDTNSLGALDRKLNPGDVVLATNLAGRGTNIKVTDEVNENGGLFVILSFLPENERVEHQAFGRTARKGKPGSAQLVISTQHLQECYRTVSSLEEAKKMRDSLAIEQIQDMQKDIDEMKLREDLFSEYCKTLQEIYKSTDEDEQKAIVPIMNEFWGIWLQTKSEEIDQLKRRGLQKSLRADLAFAKKQTESQNSPSSSIYHYVKFGNIALKDKKWDISARLFQKASKLDPSWAGIAFYNHAYCIIMQQSGDYLTLAINDLKKAQDSLKYFSEECLAGLSFIKMSSPKSANGKTSSLENQFSSKCDMLSYLDKNMSEAINKLKEIKGKERDALAKKAPVFTLVSDDEEALQMETFNLYDRGLKYIFSVEEEPRFPWEALVVFFLGVAQIVGGALLTAITFGTLAQVGMGLITEGISDCITGIESMITGEFSWQSWAIDKAISIAISLIGFGIGKLVSKGFKASKTLMKGFGKQLKAMPKFFTSQAKEGFSVTMKTNMKNAVKVTAKKIIEESVGYGIGMAEDEIISKILEEIEKEVKKGISDEVKSNMGKDPLHAITDSIILSHIENKQEFNDLLTDEIIKTKLLAIFTELSSNSLEPYSADLGWQNQLSSSISNVIDTVKEDARGKTKAILTAIQVAHMGTLAADAVHAVVTLSDKFFTGLCEGLEGFQKKRAIPQKVKASDLSDSEKKMLNDFRQEIIDSMATLLTKALVELFHQKFSSHIVSKVKSKVNDKIGEYVSTGLKTKKTEEKLKAGQDNLYTAHMSKDVHAAGQQSKSHAEKVKNSENTGSEIDIKVLSEATGTKVVILTEGKDGKLTKIQEMNPSTDDASQTVTLVYRPKSDQHPDGHYDVQINNKTVSVENGDLYRAMARGMKPDSSDDDIASAATDLRSTEAEALTEKPIHFESFIQRKAWIKALVVGSYLISEDIESGEADQLKRKRKELLNNLKEESAKTTAQNLLQTHGKNKNKIGTIGKIMNGDNRPPKNSILTAAHFNTGSKLSKVMFQVASDLSDYNECKLPVVYAPYERYHKFPTVESPELNKLLAETMSKDDVEGTFKLTILGAMPTFMLERTYFNNEDMSLTRLDTFGDSFPEHATEMVNTWFKLLESRTDLMNQDTADRLKHWINTEGYLDPNDPYRKQVTM
ncbi:uncharacterized protein LOC118226995 [Anguilla anguilla]|uniref:uncharacterized protein LOC118226995 n=1 Tax=Anguilla anguilla TaxID=7936 RepID=UPI0015ADBDC8|nr:uncharacterized protein LOC118226995 [Anguilla anguilla]